MTNTDLLKEAISKSGFKISYIAEKIGLTRVALTNKIYNRSEFKQSEIEALCNILGLKNKERNSIFFNS